MAQEQKTNLRLEIAHVLFMDIVGYSQLLIDEQREALHRLNSLVLSTDAVREAEAARSLVRLPTGDGIALVFTSSMEAPVECAYDLGRVLHADPSLPLRMGINSGSVQHVTDVNGRGNIAGSGINLAQRIMDCGDAGHILISKRVADDLAGSRRWAPFLHDLGVCEVKHGVVLSMFNFYGDGVGNPAQPVKFGVAGSGRRKFASDGGWLPGGRRILLSAVAVLSLSAVAGSVLVWRSGGGQQVTPAIPLLVVRPATPVPTPAEAPEKSIAVLPFDNFSEDKDSASFAEGVQDEVLTDLAKIADLKVISRSSVMQYKESAARDIRQIGLTLGVAYVVEGSVQRAGNHVRVRAQLVDAHTNAERWGDQYDGNLSDVFAIQSEMARKIADKLHGNLTPEEETRIAEQPTSDLEAFSLYTEATGIFVWDDWQNARQSVTRKVELLEEATQRDPRFALAYCALAKAEVDFENIVAAEVPSDGTHLQLAEAAAQSALQLRPDLGDAHRARAVCLLGRGEYDLAHKEIIIALSTLPNDAEAFQIAALIDELQDRWSGAVANLQRAHGLDPKNEEVAYYLGQAYRLTRRYQEWEQLLETRTPRNEQERYWILLGHAEIKLCVGDPVAAQTLLDQIPLSFTPTDEISLMRYRAALFRHDYHAVARVMAATPANFADDLYDGTPPESWMDGFLARVRGDEPKAQAIFAAGRRKLEVAWGGRKKDTKYFSDACLFDAGISGGKEMAIQEARQLVALIPVSQDAVAGPYWILQLALVYAWTGDREQALEQLGLVAKNPAGPTYGDLLLNPRWDHLRGDPRFEALVVSLAPKP